MRIYSMAASRIQNNHNVYRGVFLRSRWRAGNGARGFSLVEVTLAMAVISVSLLTLLGLLPGGLNTLRDADQQMVRAQIAQELAGNVLLLPYKKSAAANGADLGEMIAGGPYFYNQIGEQITNAGITEKDERVFFKATLEKMATVYPGSAEAASLTNSIATVAIKITTSRGGETESYVIQVPNTKG